MTIGYTNLEVRHKGKELSDYLVQSRRGYNIQNKVSFVTTDGATNSRKQMEIASKEYAIILGIVNDSTNAWKYDEEDEEENIYNGIENLSHLDSSRFELDQSDVLDDEITIGKLSEFSYSLMQARDSWSEITFWE